MRSRTCPPASAAKHGLPSTGISARIPSPGVAGVGEPVIAGVGGDGKSPITSPPQAAPRSTSEPAARASRLTSVVRSRHRERLSRTPVYARSVSLYRMSDPVPPLAAPVLVAAFDGWIDAAGAATACANHLAEGGEVLASFDVDSLNDYRARRPVLDVVDGVLARMQWPDIVLRHVRLGGRDLLVLVGPEPDYKWKQLGNDVMDLAIRLGVAEWISLGAIPAAVPHTRPVPILGTESAPGLLRAGVRPGPDGLLRVPAANLSVLEIAVSQAGIPAVGYFAQVPHYVSGPYPAAAT